MKWGKQVSVWKNYSIQILFFAESVNTVKKNPIYITSMNEKSGLAEEQQHSKSIEKRWRFAATSEATVNLQNGCVKA